MNDTMAAEKASVVAVVMAAIVAIAAQQQLKLKLLLTDIGCYW